MWHKTFWNFNPLQPRTLRQITQTTPGQNRRTLLLRVVLLGGLGLFFAVLCLLKLSIGISEFITRYISSMLVTLAAKLTSCLSPFSVFECLVLIGIVSAVFILTRWIRYLTKLKKERMRLFKSVSSVAIAVLCILCYYTLCAGFSYNRAPLQLPMSDTVYKREQLSDSNHTSVGDIANYFYRDYVALSETYGGKDAPYDLTEMAKRLQTEFKRLDGNPYFFRYTPRAKTITNSWFLTSSGIGGIAFLPTGEANVNTHPSPASLLPIAHTMAHELAHTKGVMRENDANLVGYYMLLTAEDDYLRFAGYYACFSEMRQAVYLGSNLDANVMSNYPTPKGTLAEWEKIRAFWDSYQGPFDWLDEFLENAAEWMNNLYLKSNGIEDGTDSYHDFPSGSTDTGQTNPDTGEIIYEPYYNNIQKIFFAIYEKAHSDN